MVFKRILALILCVSVLSVGAVAFASERDETVSSEYVSISGSYCVVDSLYGVDAIYSWSSSEYHCFEYVYRFYETIYGIEVEYSSWSLPDTNDSSCWFETATTPKTGDIAFASASRRGGSDHWAIVKSYDEENGTITLIEQNYKWNGAAEVNREITYPSSYYEIYTLVNADGAVEPIIDVSVYDEETFELPDDEEGAVLVQLTEEEEIETASGLEGFTITGEYSDYVLPFAGQANALGMEIRTSGYTEEIDAETFCELLISLLEVSDYEFSYVNPVKPGGSALDTAWAMGLIDESVRNSNPDLTRERAAVIMQNLADYLGLTVSYSSAEVAEFADYDDISSWAVDAIAEMMEMEIMDGSTLYGAYTFQPSEILTYEQALTMVMRLYNYVPDVVVSTVTAQAAAAVPAAASADVLPTE